MVVVNGDCGEDDIGPWVPGAMPCGSGWRAKAQGNGGYRKTRPSRCQTMAIGPEDDGILHFLRGQGVSVGDVVGLAVWAKKWGHQK